MWRQAIDELKGPLTEYMRNITPCYNGHGTAVFTKTVYKQKTYIKFKKKEDILDNDEEHHFYLSDLEEWHVFDVNRYNKKELTEMVKEFVLGHNHKKLETRLGSIRQSEKFIEVHKFPLYQEYTNEYMSALHDYK